MPDRVFAASTIRARLAVILILAGFLLFVIPTFFVVYATPDGRLSEAEYRRIMGWDNPVDNGPVNWPVPIRVQQERDREAMRRRVQRNLAQGLDPNGNAVVDPIPAPRREIINGRMRLILLPPHEFDVLVARFEQMRAQGHFPNFDQDELAHMFWEIREARRRLDGGEVDFDNLPGWFLEPVPRQEDGGNFALYQHVILNRLRHDMDDDMPDLIDAGDLPPIDDREDEEDEDDGPYVPPRLLVHLNYQNGVYGPEFPTWDQAKREIDSGRKVGHWIWYVFPSLRSVREGSRYPHLILRDKEEARAYIGVDVLRDRLRKIINAAAVQIYRHGISPTVLFATDGDAVKFWECVTVFFLLTSQHQNHPEWERLHKSCQDALYAMWPDKRPEERLNERARAAYFPGP